MYFACDFETTGLLLPEVADLDKQPRIVQAAWILLDEAFNEVSTMNVLINPGVPIPQEVSKIHGITDEMVADKLGFDFYQPMIEVAMKDATWVGQNVPFDKGVLHHELRRIGKTLPETPSLDLMDFIVSRYGRRRKLGDVYAEVLGKPLHNAHNALADISATVELLKEMMK